MGNRQLVIEVSDEDYIWLLKKTKKIKPWIDKNENVRGGQKLALSTDAEYIDDDYSITINNIIDLTPGG